MKSIVKNSFYQLLIVYTILVAVAFFGFISRFTLHFEIFALVIAFMGYFVIERNSETINKNIHRTLFIV